MRIWILARTTGEPDWVESSSGVDVGISLLKVGQLHRSIAMTSAPYLPPRALRMHEELLRACGLRPGLYLGAYVQDDCLVLGPVVGVMVGDRTEVLFSSQVRRLVSANHDVGCLLYFFQPEDVMIDEGKVVGLTFSPTPGWVNCDMPLPDVIYDQTEECPPEIREYLLRGGARALNQRVTKVASSVLVSIAEPGGFRLQWQGRNQVIVLMQRDDLGLWHYNTQPDMEQRQAVTALCHRVVHELERITGCLGEVQVRLICSATGRCRLDGIDFLPDKRNFTEGTFKLPLLFSRRLAGFPPVT